MGYELCDTSCILSGNNSYVTIQVVYNATQI